MPFNLKTIYSLRKHISPLFLVLVVLPILALSTWIVFTGIKSGLQAAEERHEAALLQAEIDATPEPSIEILSSMEPLGGVAEYELIFSVENEDYIIVNSKYILTKEQDSIEGTYTLSVPLSSTESTIEVHAYNQHKEAVVEFSIQRELTPEEIAILEEEQRLLEEEQLAQEQAEQAKEAEELAEQRAWEQSKAGQICTQHPSWEDWECEKLADGKYWIGMTIDMLKSIRGRPNSVTPSNYGYGNEWQWCWWNYTPSCFYGGDDGIIESYN